MGLKFQNFLKIYYFSPKFSKKAPYEGLILVFGVFAHPRTLFCPSGPTGLIPKALSIRYPRALLDTSGEFQTNLQVFILVIFLDCIFQSALQSIGKLKKRKIANLTLSAPAGVQGTPPFRLFSPLSFNHFINLFQIF